MDLTTYLPILLALGLVILPEFNSKGCRPCRKVCCGGCSMPQPQENPCLTGGRVTSCTEQPINLCGIRWNDAPDCECDCQLCEAQSLVDAGFESWRTDPVAVATRFMGNCFIDECFRGYPTYLVGKCRECDKVYVVLGVSCAGKMIFELCQPVKDGDCGIWIVNRYGEYCN